MLFSLDRSIQLELIPRLENEVGTLSAKEREFVRVVELAQVDKHMGPYRWSGKGRKPIDRKPFVLAFIAKAVWNFPTTRLLIDYLKTSRTLRFLCGWDEPSDIPGEYLFSRAFAAFAEGRLPELIHESMVRRGFENRIVGHISRDSTAIIAREKPTRKADAALQLDSTGEEAGSIPQQILELMPKYPAPKRTRQGKSARVLPTKAIDVILRDMRDGIRKGALRKNVGEQIAKGAGKKAAKMRTRRRKASASEPKRLELQCNRGLEENLSDLPKQCNVGAKRNSKGNYSFWIGYKFHIDVTDCDIPVSAVLTSASVHDSQVAIPLMQMTTGRVIYLYEIADSAYDAKSIKDCSLAFDHVPITDPNKRGGEAVPLEPTEQIRYRQRSSVERVNSNLHDNYGGRFVRVRGHKKVMAHLMFGLVALTANQLYRLLE